LQASIPNIIRDNGLKEEQAGGSSGGCA